MELRNIKRYILTGKAIRKYNKHASIEMTKERLTVLATIHFMHLHKLRANQTNLRKYLATLAFDIHWRNLTKHLFYFTNANLIINKGGNYTLTIEGKYLLQALEKKIRLERLDK